MTVPPLCAVIAVLSAGTATHCRALPAVEVLKSALSCKVNLAKKCPALGSKAPLRRLIPTTSMMLGPCA